MTTEHTLIVARMQPADAAAVADIFATSDTSELPELVGVRRRSLFRYGEDLYFHLIESDPGAAASIEAVRSHPLYVDINDRLARHIRAYDPETWRSPADAMAHRFYDWRADAGVVA